MKTVDPKKAYNANIEHENKSFSRQTLYLLVDLVQGVASKETYPG